MLLHQQSNAQTSPSQASTVCELRTSSSTSWIQKRQRPTAVGVQKKQEKFRKTFTSASLTMLKPLTMQITTKCGKFLKRGKIRSPYLSPEKPVCRSRKKQIELNIEQWTGSKLGQEYIKAVHHHPAYLTYMQSTSCEIPG